MRTALLPSAPSTEGLPTWTAPAAPLAGRSQLRPSRQVQRAYVRQRFIAGWGAINPEVARAVRRHRARLDSRPAPAPLGALHVLAT
jgi:hypothetical protein